MKDQKKLFITLLTIFNPDIRPKVLPKPDHATLATVNTRADDLGYLDGMRVLDTRVDEWVRDDTVDRRWANDVRLHVTYKRGQACQWHGWNNDNDNGMTSKTYQPSQHR